MPRPNVAGPMTDPLAAFMAHRQGGMRPVPLVSTAVEVEIEGGLAVVSTRRVFRNAEAQSIEAVLTFPVPVHATLFALEARIEKRLLVATAQRRDAARETYENAVADGRTAILHEEVLRGVHMLSVAPLGPDAEVEVTARWVATLAFIGGTGQLRIPMTVGDVYGSSGLPESDDLLHGGETGWAELTVRSPDGAVELLGGTLAGGRGRVPLDAPVDLLVRDPQPRSLRGVSADGGARSGGDPLGKRLEAIAAPRDIRPDAPRHRRRVEPLKGGAPELLLRRMRDRRRPCRRAHDGRPPGQMPDARVFGRDRVVGIEEGLDVLSHAGIARIDSGRERGAQLGCIGLGPVRVHPRCARAFQGHSRSLRSFRRNGSTHPKADLRVKAPRASGRPRPRARRSRRE
jgi:hypothetical protein